MHDDFIHRAAQAVRKTVHALKRGLHLEFATHVLDDLFEVHGREAVIQTQKGSMVVVIGEGDKAEMRPVDLGDNYGDSFLLNKGVKAGERIVVEGGNKAVPGQPVRIQQASVQDAKLPDQPVGTGSDSGKAE